MTVVPAVADDRLVLQGEFQNEALGGPVVDRVATVTVNLQRVGSPITLTGQYSYTGTNVKGSVLLTGSDTVLVEGPDERLQDVRVCVESKWTVAARVRIATSVNVTWNGLTYPLEDDQLEGLGPERQRLLSKKITESVTYTDCRIGRFGEFGPFPNTSTLVIAGVQRITSVSHSLTVRAELRDGTVLKATIPGSTSRSSAFRWSQSAQTTF
jgi:hypothetical protein